VVTGQMLNKDDIVRWQRRLDEQGYLVVGWPKEHGGPGWTPTQRYLFDLERAAANAPVGLSMGVIMLGPVLMAFGTERRRRATCRASGAARTGGARAIPSPARAPTWPA
jgi:alkylation response protein AidB-like acyl-CoA dehydrogenase